VQEKVNFYSTKHLFYSTEHVIAYNIFLIKKKERFTQTLAQRYGVSYYALCSTNDNALKTDSQKQVDDFLLPCQWKYWHRAKNRLRDKTGFGMYNPQNVDKGVLDNPSVCLSVCLAVAFPASSHRRKV